jgi:hypothetical protein
VGEDEPFLEGRKGVQEEEEEGEEEEEEQGRRKRRTTVSVFGLSKIAVRRPVAGFVLR